MRWGCGCMAEVPIGDLAFGLGLLTAVFVFHRNFIRPVIEWRKEMESRVASIEKSVRRHELTDNKVLAAIRGMESDIGEIKTKIAVLEERSQHWGK